MVVSLKNMIMIDKRRWLVQFDCNDDADQFMRYDCVLKYVDKDALNFTSFNLWVWANPIPPPQQEATHHNKRFAIANKLDWT